MHQYKYLWVPITALILAQLIKFTIESIHCKQLKWGRLFNGSGGMPSSHTTFTVSLTTMVGFYETLTSPMFAICLVFTCIVMYDAIGLRLESGKQASMINQIVDEIFSKNTGSCSFKRTVRP